MKSFVVVGLGYGDEGKGATVDFLCDHYKAECVVKYSGGHQAGHRVVVGDKEHVFAQYGAGALAGCYTILDRDFIIEPMAMLEERKALEKLGGNTTLLIHPCCPITTRYHRAFNRLVSKVVGGNNTCGLGVGATRSTANLGIGIEYKLGGVTPAQDAIHRLRSYLLAEAKRIEPECYEYELFMNEMNVSPREVAEEIVFALVDCHAYRYGGEPLTGTVVFEGSQGVLLDETYGDIETSTYSTVTPRNAFEFPGFDRSQAKVIGVMRTYMTRHGRGEFPIPGKLTVPPDVNNTAGGFQGPMRYAEWGMSHLYRSIRIAKPDVLAVNHTDILPVPPYFGVDVAITGSGPSRADRKLIKELL